MNEIELQVKAQRVFGIENSCRRKVRYKTREDAERNIVGWNSDRRKIKMVYRCFYCSGYHIGRYISDAELHRIVNKNYDENGNYIGPHV